MAIEPHVCGSWHITNPKKNEKIHNVHLKNFVLFLKVMVFPKKKEFIMHLLFKCAKNI